MKILIRRLRVRFIVWNFVPILFDRPHEWRLGVEVSFTGRQSRRCVLDCIRDWLVWVDGNLPNSDMELGTRCCNNGVLVDDASWHDFGIPHCLSDELGFDQIRHQGATCDVMQTSGLEEGVSIARPRMKEYRRQSRCMLFGQDYRCKKRTNGISGALVKV